MQKKSNNREVIIVDIFNHRLEDMQKEGILSVKELLKVTPERIYGTYITSNLIELFDDKLFYKYEDCNNGHSIFSVVEDETELKKLEIPYFKCSILSKQHFYEIEDRVARKRHDASRLINIPKKTKKTKRI